METLDRARLLEAELKLAEVKKKVYALQIAINDLTTEVTANRKALSENTRLDQELRKLVNSHVQLKRHSNLRFIRVTITMAALLALYMFGGLPASHLVETILAITTALGWWATRIVNTD